MDGKFWGKITISAVILGLAMFAFNTLTTTSDATKLLLPPVQASAIVEQLQDTVILARSEVAVQEKGHLARAAFAIDNSSDQDIKNIKVLCTLLDNAGNEQGRDQWVIYDTIKAHANGTFSYTSKMYVSNRATASQCQIVDMEIATAPLIAVHRGNAESQGGHQKTQDALHGGASH